MHPVLFRVAPLHIVVRSYTVLLLLAILLGLLAGSRRVARLESLDQQRVRRALALLGIIALAGGHLHFVVGHWHRLSGDPLAALTGAGLHAPGVVAAAVLAAPIVLRAFGLPTARVADAMTAVMSVAFAVVRVGCFLEGCCFGLACSLPWCVSFPRGSFAHTFQATAGLIPADAPRTLSLHPLQLYFVCSQLLIASVALWLQPRRRYAGQVTLVGLWLFSASTAVLESFRADYGLGYLRPSAIAMVAASTLALIAAEIVKRRGTPGVLGRA